MNRRAALVSIVLAAFALTAAAASDLRIGGRVLVPGGSPLPQAEVQLLPLAAPLADAREILEEEPQPVARAMTNAAGQFQIVAPHAGLWRVRVVAPGFVPLDAALRPLIEPIELEDAQLVADAGLKVKLVGPDGSPLAGALVLARTDRGRFDYGGSAWSAPWRHGTTDGDGIVTLPKGAAERVAISASLGGYAVGERRGLTGGAANMKLIPAVTQQIEVRARDGKPVGDVLLAVGSRPHPYGTTDEAGKITAHFEPGQSGELNLLAEDGRTLTTRLEIPEKPADKPRVLTLPDRALVAGKLIDAESRRPIEGGLVWDPESAQDGAVTDRSGTFAIGGPEGARIRMTAGAPGYLSGFGTEFQFSGDGRPGPTLALSPAAAIEGKIVDSDGEVVVGAEVTIEKKQTPGMMRIEIGAPSTAPRNLSGSRGEFRLSPIDPDERWAIKVDAEGFAPAEHAISGLEPYATKSGVEITLERGQKIVGTVVDESSRPLREVAVTLKPDNARSSGMMRIMDSGDADVSFAGTTDAAGRFEIAGLPSGRFALEARRKGFAKGKIAGIEIAKGGEVVDLGEVVLEPGERVQGFVTDRDGQPVEGVEVHVREGGGPQMMMILGDSESPEPEPGGVTDPTGWFAVDDLAVGEKFDLSFSRAGFVDTSVKGIELPRVEPVEAVMEPASDVSGRVLDPDGEPIAGAQVSLKRRQTVEMGGSVMMMMMMESDSTDAEGRFLFEDEAPGKIALSAVASGFQEGQLASVEVPKGQDLEGIELNLPAGAVLVGQVFAPDGRPLIGARVSKVSTESGPMRMLGGNASDGNGSYRVEGLAPGAISIEATHDDYPRAVKDIELDEGMNTLDLHLEGGVEVSGRVTDTDGRPLPDAVARLLPAGLPWGGPETTTEPDGTFEMPGVQDGDYRLRIESVGFAPYEGKQSIHVAGQPVQGLEARLDAGASVSGRITGLDPSEFADVSVSAQGPIFAGFGEGNPVDREGNYRVENLVPGSYEIAASLGGSGKKATGLVTIEEGVSEAALDLEFEAGLTLSGKAVQGDAPVVGVTVFVEGLDLDHTGWGQTDHAGAFSIEGLQPGSYQVNLRDYSSGLAYNEKVELATSREIVLEVPTARVAGRVVDTADRRPLAGVTLTLNSDAPGSQGRLPLHAATTDLEGRFEISSVADGSWRLAANKEGYAALSRAVIVQFDKPAEDLDLTMDATEGMTIEARLPSGGAPNEVLIAVLDPAGGALVSGSYPTGENGRVRLSSVPPGRWNLVVSAVGSATTNVEARAPGTTVPVALQPATRLRVTVPDLAQAGTLATVHLMDAAGKMFHTLSWTGRPQNEWNMTGGEIEFGSLPPGGWRVSVTTPDGGSWSGDSVTRPGEVAELRLE